MDMACGIVLDGKDGTRCNATGGSFIGDGKFVGITWWVGLASIFRVRIFRSEGERLCFEVWHFGIESIDANEGGTYIARL